MKNKIYHLSSCNTCQRIIKELGAEHFELQNIKEHNIDEKMLDWVAEQAGGYEAIFSKRAMKYRAMGLNEMSLTEEDYRKHMLDEYTFLKRPFVIVGDVVFIGNAKKTVEAAKAALDAQ